MAIPRFPSILRAACIAAVSMLLPCAVMAQPGKPTCNVEATKKALQSPPAGVLAALSSAISSDNCGSVLAVLRLAGSTKRVGGRKLEPDKPLNQQEAQAERASVAADPELASELHGQTDPARRLLLEAAFLHDKGLYKGRDLLLAQLRGEAP